MEHEVGWHNEGGLWSAWTSSGSVSPPFTIRTWVLCGEGDRLVSSRPGVLATFVLATNAAVVPVLAVAGIRDHSVGEVLGGAFWALLVAVMAWSMLSGRRHLLDVLHREGPPPVGSATSSGWTRPGGPVPSAVASDPAGHAGAPFEVWLVRYGTAKDGRQQVEDCEHHGQYATADEANAAMAELAATRPARWDAVQVQREREGAADVLAEVDIEH